MSDIYYATMRMEITDDIAKVMANQLGLEIEMMQGTKEPLPDGRTRYVIKLDEEKGELVKEFIIRCNLMTEPPEKNN